MVEEPARDGNYFALGVLVGAALGMVLALLFAPQPGKDIRATFKPKDTEPQRSQKAQSASASAAGIMGNGAVATEDGTI